MDPQKELNDALNQLGLSLGELVGQASFTIFQEEEFRKLTNFDKISQVEQDRIFNELEVSLIGLFMLYLDNLEIEMKRESLVIKKIKSVLKSGFLELLASFGIEKKFIDTWNLLIDLRLKEYRKDYKMLCAEIKKDPEFAGNVKDISTTKFARIQTITLDCVEHIRRGVLEEKDPLIRYIRKWVILNGEQFSQKVQASIFNPQAKS